MDYIVFEPVFSLYLQMERHMRTVCTHQLRACDYRDDGCLFMVRISQKWVSWTFLYVGMHAVNMLLYLSICRV